LERVAPFVRVNDKTTQNHQDDHGARAGRQIEIDALDADLAKMR